MTITEKLKLQQDITRQDIADLLESLGKPGKNQEAKLEAVKSLNRVNVQGLGLEHSLSDYPQF